MCETTRRVRTPRAFPSSDLSLLSTLLLTERARDAAVQHPAQDQGASRGQGQEVDSGVDEDARLGGGRRRRRRREPVGLREHPRRQERRQAVLLGDQGPVQAPRAHRGGLHGVRLRRVHRHRRRPGARRRAEEGEEAKRRIEAITADVEVGQIYEGPVVKLLDFGAVVSLIPGKDGLVHISQIAHQRVNAVSDFVKEGDIVKVKVVEIDSKGKVRLSMKALIEEPGKEPSSEE